VVLQGAVTVLLLIACANIAGLVLARSLGRSPEFGLRAALGASRWRLTRQLVTESLLLAAVGGAAGVLLGRWLLDGLLLWLLTDMPAWIQLGMDYRFLAFICAAIALCGRPGRPAPGEAPAPPARSARHPRAGRPPRPERRSRGQPAAGLVVTEIALALLLLLMAARSAGFPAGAAHRPRHQADRVLTYAIQLPQATYPDDAARIVFFSRHLERLRALPGVEAASASTVLPFSGQHIGNFFEPEGGLPGGPDAQAPVVLTRMSFPGYFETMGIPLAGRPFTEQDWRYRIIVNETLARTFWPGENAVGKRIRGIGSSDPWLEVIGVARDVRHYGWRRRCGRVYTFRSRPCRSRSSASSCARKGSRWRWHHWCARCSANRIRRCPPPGSPPWSNGSGTRCRCGGCTRS